MIPQNYHGGKETMAAILVFAFLYLSQNIEYGSGKKFSSAALLNFL